MNPSNNQSTFPSNYQVYLLRLQREAESEKWVISLQYAQENKQRVFADLDSLALYLSEQMSTPDKSI